MANHRSKSKYQPERWRHRPTVTEGIVYDGTPECAEAIMRWQPTKFVLDDYDNLCAWTADGLRTVCQGDAAVLDADGVPYTLRSSIREVCYDPAAGNDYSTWLTTADVMAIQRESLQTGDPDRLRGLIRRLAASHEARPLGTT
jgi:hypothetical protein